jgi:hypothetical protein
VLGAEETWRVRVSLGEDPPAACDVRVRRLSLLDLWTDLSACSEPELRVSQFMPDASLCLQSVPQLTVDHIFDSC